MKKLIKTDTTDPTATLVTIDLSKLPADLLVDPCPDLLDLDDETDPTETLVTTDTTDPTATLVTIDLSKLPADLLVDPCPDLLDLDDEAKVSEAKASELHNTLSWLRWSPRHVRTIREHIQECHAIGHAGGLWCREHEFWCGGTHVSAVTTGCGVREIHIDGAQVSDSDLREFFGGSPWHPSETIRTEADNP